MSETGSLYVFIEGDGVPWRAGGIRVAEDPTPRRPLALSLAAQTPGSVVYLGRPCYYLARSDAACRSRIWTAERYSAEVSASMAAVVNRISAKRRSTRVILIGYSGGGTLAVLMAPLVTRAAAVVTLAANLDIDAWARWHHFTPLVGSLNPATQPPLPLQIQQWHLVGDLDTAVPPRLSQKYLSRLASDQTWHYAKFDHVCCWAERWPELLTRVNATLGSGVAEPQAQPP